MFQWWSAGCNRYCFFFVCFWFGDRSSLQVFVNMSFASSFSLKLSWASFMKKFKSSLLSLKKSNVLEQIFQIRGKCDFEVLLVVCSGAITKLKISVGWTTDKFWLNNSLAINGTILRFAYRKIDVQRRTFANLRVERTG